MEIKYNLWKYIQYETDEYVWDTNEQSKKYE